MDMPKRKAVRLKDYDYSTPGAYFITICVHNRRNILSDIVGEGSPLPKKSGKIAIKYIEQINPKYPTIFVDKYVVMPNHIHLLLSVKEVTGRGNPSPTTDNIERAMGWFKYNAAKEINSLFGTSGQRVFQRSFHDHIIRDEKDYLKIWNYIDINPAKWEQDCFYTEQ